MYNDRCLDANVRFHLNSVWDNNIRFVLFNYMYKRDSIINNTSGGNKFASSFKW